MRYVFILLSCIVCFNSFAQQHDNNWLIGAGQYTTKSTQITFNNNLVVDSIYRSMEIDRAAISVSDSLGNLIFYSNGIKIHNAQYQLMQNGDSLNPGQIADNFRQSGYPINEGMIVVPHPVQTNKYYAFHQASTNASALAGFADKLYYTVVDMNANGGLGRVEIKNQILLENDSICPGQLEVVKHGNGRDWWLIQPMGFSNGYHIFLIAGNSITYHHKQYLGNVKIWGNEMAGQAIFNHQGNQYFRYDHRSDLDIYDFDRCSGYFSNYLHIPIVDSVDNLAFSVVSTGAAVSPNDRYLYVSSWIYLYQFDLWASNIAASKDTVAIFDNYMYGVHPVLFGYIQSAPDGKIYSHVNNTPYMHVINDPDVGGIGCNVVQRGLDIFFVHGHFLPNMPHYRTPKLSGSACDTLTSVAAIPSSVEGSLLVYPNPANTSITIETSTSIAQVVVYDALGREVLRSLVGKESAVALDITSLENGTYVVSVGLENGELLTDKVVVLRE